MFDSHVHFDAEPFIEHLDDVVARTRAAGVTGALNPSIDLETSRAALEVHRRHPWILPCLGLHPLYLDPHPQPPVSRLEALAASGGYAAVGEVGLDFWRGRADEERQRLFLGTQAEMAQRLGLPVVLHTRKGFYETFSVLREAGFAGTGVCHAFTGSRAMARLALDRGFYLAAGATLTYPGRVRLREVFRWAPRDRILVETDAPDIPPWERRGKLHRPWDLPVTVAALAATLEVCAEDAAAFTEQNARRVFTLPAAPNPGREGASA